MKYYQHIATLALALLLFQANAQNSVTMNVLPTDKQDMQVYSKKKSGTFPVVTKHWFSQFWGFWNQSLVASSEFQNLEQDGCVLPVGAKVTHIYLKGFNRGGKTTTLNAKTYIESVADDYVLDAKKGYNSVQLPDAQHVYSAGANGIVTTTFSPTSTESNPDYVENIPLYRPFVYEGKDVLISMDQWYDGDPMKFSFETSTAIDSRTISVFRSGKKGTGDTVVPAFILDYYTNDLRGEVEGATGAMVKLYDIDAQQYVIADGATALNGDNACPVNADGKFSYTNLNYTHSYKLTVTSEAGTVEKTLNFDGESTAAPTAGAVKNDLNVKVVM